MGLSKTSPLPKSAFAVSFLIVASSLLFSGCATLIGGSKYNAIIQIQNRPNARIIYGGREIGRGNALVKVNRTRANQFSFAVEEEGCETQVFQYRSRVFRGWALVGSIFSWSASLNGILVPYGLVIDLLSGAFWKPDIREPGVSKNNYKNYRYTVFLPDCEDEKSKKKEKGGDTVYLKNGSIIRGKITEEIPGVQLKIESDSGNLFIVKVEEVEKITHD